MQRELALIKRLAQRIFQRPARLDGGVHFRLEETEDAAAVALGAVQRHVGVLEQVVGRGAVIGRDRDADAGIGDDHMPEQIVGFADRLADALRQSGGVVDVGDVRQDDGEFVAADACHSDVFVDAAAQPIGDALEQFVAVLVTERVVDRLEIIEVEIEDRQPFFVHGASSVSASRSWNSTRFGRSVSASWCAMCAMIFSARRRSVMSSWVATQPPSGIGELTIAMVRPFGSSMLVLNVSPRAIRALRLATYSSGSPGKVPAAFRAPSRSCKTMPGLMSPGDRPYISQ